MNRKGLELSLNVLIILLISIIIFSYSLYFLYNLWIGTQDLPEKIDEQTSLAIKKMIGQDNELVAIPFHSKTASIGETVVFWMGIRNINEQEEEFKAKTEFVEAYNQNTQVMEGISSARINEWLGNSKDFKIGKISPKQYKEAQIGVNVEEFTTGAGLTKPGIYVFSVCVYKTTAPNECYGGKTSINVVVE